MSEPEVKKAVDAVLSAFHDSAELANQFRKKTNRRSAYDKKSDQHDSEQKQLYESLETGEQELSQRFASDVRELGALMSVGDAIARDRLLHVSRVVRAEIIKSLELAVRFENAAINLKILCEASVTHRKDGMNALDELKQRIRLTRIIPRILPGTPKGQGTSLGHKPVPTSSVENSASAPRITCPAEKSPAPGNSKHYDGGLVSYFYLRHSESSSSTSDSNSQRGRSSSESSNFSTTSSPAFDHLLREKGSDNRAAIMKDIDELIVSYQGLQTDGNKRDTWAILTGGDVSKRDTLALKREAMEMLQLQNLPPTPEEANDGVVPTNDIHTSIRNPMEQTQPQQLLNAPPNLSKPLPQRPSIQEQRWSGSSSVYSDTVPGSLYSYGSRSSNESPYTRDRSPQRRMVPQAPYNARNRSPQRPVVPQAPPVRAPPAPPFTTSQRPQTPPKPTHSTQRQRTYPPPTAPPAHPEQQRSITPPIAPFALPGPEREATPPAPVLPFAVPPRSLTPPINPFAIFQRPRTPVQDKRTTRIHLVPGSDSPPSSISALASSSTTAVITPYTIPPPAASPPKPQPPKHTLSNTSTTSSNSSPLESHAGQAQMSGRPSKQNNYWGFCKGAWTIRDDLKRGLEVQTRPDGMYNAHQIWQCRHCHFQGETFSAAHPTKKGKKQTVVDPNVYVSAVGIRYKWIFLAKSHVRKKGMVIDAHNPLSTTHEKHKLRDGSGKEDCNYGCLICSVEGSVTGVYGNVETLMNHIFLEHARSIGDEVAGRARCVVGRRAGAEEEWDLNILGREVLAA